MLKVSYSPRFVKKFKKLPRKIQTKALEREKIFKKNPEDPRLKTHPLSGKLKDFYSFSVTYQYRIMFALESDGSVTFIDIGTHSIYR